jgi:taurine dioxygenase
MARRSYAQAVSSHKPARLVRKEEDAASRPVPGTYKYFKVDKLTPTIGGEIQNVDIRKALDNDEFASELRRALSENLVIFFRDQELSQEQHLSFGKLWGKLHLHPAAPHEPGHPELMIVKTHKNSNRANGEDWHTDVSCDVEPPLGSILYIKECPPEGGDTLFANMYAAYDSLSDKMKSYLHGMTALHDGEPFYRGLYANDGLKDKEKYPQAVQPVIRTHPITKKKALYVNRVFTQELVGIPRDESRSILTFLFEHMENPIFQCRFRWRAKSIAFWDNRCAQHRAMWDYWPHVRYGNRVTVQGEKPE